MEGRVCGQGLYGQGVYGQGGMCGVAWIVWGHCNLVW